MAAPLPSAMDSSHPPAIQEDPVQTCNWLELPRDVAITILMKLTAIEVLESTQFVCKLWYHLCKEPAMWRVIDGENLGEPQLQSAYEKMAFNAVDRSAGGLVEINMEYFCSDGLLAYVAERARDLKCIRMRCCYQVSDDALIETVKKLPVLEEVEMTLCSFSEEAVKAIGFNCPRLSTFRLNETGTRDPSMADDVFALAIAESMPHVHHLQLIGNNFTNEGLQAIVYSCPNLKSLDLRSCFQLNLSGGFGKKCAKLIKNLRLPNEPTHDYKFITCYDSEYYDSEYDEDGLPFAEGDFISDDDYYELSYDSELLDSDYGEFLYDDDVIAENMLNFALSTDHDDDI